MKALADNDGDPDAVARAMGRDPYQIHRWLQRFDLEPGSFDG